MCDSPPGTGSSLRFYRPPSFLNHCGLDLREIWVVTVHAEGLSGLPCRPVQGLPVPSVLLALDGVVIQSAGCFPLAYCQ